MKKCLYSVVTVIFLVTTLLSIVSCGDDVNELDGGGSMSIVGTWVPTEEPYYINFYWEFTSKEVKYYELNSYSEYAEYRDGYIYTPKGCKWNLEMKEKYEIEGNSIFVSGINVGSFKKVSNNKVIFRSDYLVDGVVEKVKGFKTK